MGRRFTPLGLDDVERAELTSLASRRTSSSWLNQVERFFALITERKIRRGIYRSVAALRAEIASFIEHHNADPRPFRWTKSADDILRSIERFCAYNLPAKV